MNLLLLFLTFTCLVYAGVLKNTEDQPLLHQGSDCGLTKCPANYQCELPLATAECNNESECSSTPKCVRIPVSATTCEENEEVRECGSPCEPTCVNQERTCDSICMTNVCQCKDGFVRDENTGKCVMKENCSKCNLECSSEEKCEFVELTCEKKPCQFVDVCVAKEKL